jgi:hypothetical protein
MNDQAGIALSRGQYEALSHHLGALTMEAVCSVARARELEAQNEELRAQLTQARMDAQRQHEIAQAARASVKELQDVIAGNKPLGRIPKPRVRKSPAK